MFVTIFANWLVSFPFPPVQAAGGRLHFGSNLVHLPSHGVLIGVAHARHPQGAGAAGEMQATGGHRGPSGRSRGGAAGRRGASGNGYYDLWYPKARVQRRLYFEGQCALSTTLEQLPLRSTREWI